MPDLCPNVQPTDNTQAAVEQTATAVLNATDEWASFDIPTALIAAAAFRAAVDKLLPEEPALSEVGPKASDFRGWGRRGQLIQRRETRAELLALADELESRVQ